MSAHDIAILSSAIIREYPKFYAWYSEKEYEHNNIVQYNRNKLLWKDSSVDGLKTGHTEAAGYCLVGSAERNGQRWIAVVLGSKDERSRENAVQSLLDFGFAAYQPVQTLDQQGGLATAQVYLGEVDEVLLQAEHAVNIVVPHGRESDVVVDMQLSPYYLAPIEIGQAMGIATLTLDNKQLADVSLVSMSSIKRGGLWKRFTDSVSLKWREFREK
jgi:D-alanyl-D-alanine carboxypeptidase (penicillin-binding protein 5/6)